MIIKIWKIGAIKFDISQPNECYERLKLVISEVVLRE